MEGDDVLKWGLWVYKIRNIERGTDPPAIFAGWKRYFMWINKGTIYYGDEEGKPKYDIPVAACRSAERFDPDEFAQKKGRDAPSMLTDFAWLLKTVEYTVVFVSDSESQCLAWIDGINSMLPRHQRTLSGFNGHSNIVPLNNGTGFSQSNFPGSPLTASALHSRNNRQQQSNFDDDAVSLGRSTQYNQHDRRESYQHNSMGNYHDPMASSGVNFTNNTRTPTGQHLRSSSYGNYGHAYGTLEGGNGSGSKGFSQQNRSGGSAYQSPSTASLAYNGPGQLVVQTSEWDLMSNRHSRTNTNTGLVSRDDPDTDVVALGSWVQKVKGDNADKTTSWNKRYMWMEDGGILWYGSERGNKDRSIPVRDCTSVERLTDEEMYTYKAPSHLFRFGLRLRMTKGGSKCWVFACDSEAITVGWYKVWKKLIPLTAEELALEVQLTYEENMHASDYYTQQHRLAEEKRKRDEAKKKQDEENMKKKIDIMTKSMFAAAAVQEEQRLAKEKKDKEDKEKADQKKREELAQARLDAQRKAKEEEDRRLKDAVVLEMELQKRLSAQRSKDMEAQQLFMEKEVERRMTEMKLKNLEEELARKKKEEEDAKKAEEERQRQAAERARLQKELEDDEARMADVHNEMVKRNQKKDSTGCCVIS